MPSHWFRNTPGASTSRRSSATRSRGIFVRYAGAGTSVSAAPMFQSGGKFVGAERYIEILRLQRPALTHTHMMNALRVTLTEQAP